MWRIIAQNWISVSCVLGLGLITMLCGCPAPDKGNPPAAAFITAPASGPAPLPVAFLDYSIPGDQPIHTWKWDFGDGYASTEQNPTHEYKQPGTYTVTLQVESAAGSDGETRIAAVQVRPGSETVLGATVIVPEDIPGMQLQEMSEAHLAFTYPSGYGAPVNPGDYLISAEKDGYLRKAATVAQKGERITIQTQDAVLTDIVEQADLHGNTIFDEAAFAKSGIAYGLDQRGYLLINNVRIYEDNGLLIDLNGELDFKPSIDLDIQFKERKVNYFIAAVSGRLSAQLDITMRGQLGTAISFEKPLYELMGAKERQPGREISVPVSYIPMNIGRLPVLARVDLDILVGGEVGTTGAVAFDGGFGASSLVMTGVEYADGNWHDVNTLGFEPSLHLPQLNTSVKTHMRVYLKPQLRVRLLGKMGPYLGIENYSQLRVEPIPAPLKAYYGVGMDAVKGFSQQELRIFGVGFSRGYEERTIGFYYPLWSYTGQSNPAKVTVPNVVGMAQATAEATIASAGLAIGAITQQASDTVPVGQVISQNPAANLRVAAGTSVNIVVSSGQQPPANPTVPNVIGLTQAAAEAAITGAGLTVGAITQQASDEYPDGRIMSQNPAAGASVVAGTAVSLVISQGSTTGAYDYTTRTNEVLRQSVQSSKGVDITVPAEGTIIPGVNITIPPNALGESTTVIISEVDNPPFLPTGLNFVGNPVLIGPEDAQLSQPVLLELPYSDGQLSDAGITSDVALRVYIYNSGAWQETQVQTIDTVGNIVVAAIEQFGIIAIVGSSMANPVEKQADIDHPKPGDLLFKESHGGWYPGHVGIYVGEKIDRDGNRYNVVEALIEDGVVRNHYDPLDDFSGSDKFLGVREPETGTLTDVQRVVVVDYVEQQVGKPYAIWQTAGVGYGMLEGRHVKGPSSFNCVGLAEKAYELAGVNDGMGLVSTENEGSNCVWVVCIPGALTPAEQFAATRPAGSGVAQGPVIEWAKLTPDHGTPCTMVTLEVAVSHPLGLGFIDRVTYVTNSGYTNPNIYINDDGIDGDARAGDGIYSVMARAGGEPSLEDYFSITLTVTDLASRADEIELQYWYTGDCKDRVCTDASLAGKG